MNKNELIIGDIKINLQYYRGKDLYNEGDEVEDKILYSLENDIDPIKVIQEDNRWPILYQLSPTRKNIIGPMNIKNTDQVLEVGAGMGALSGTIAQRCAFLDCIELSKRRSIANAHRNKNHSNINIYVGNFTDITITKQYDVIILIGVLEYAGSYIQQNDPYNAFLQQLRKYLKPEGILYIAIENRFGLKYLSGCYEDHTGQPFIGIEGYHSCKVKTFTRPEIISLLKNNGFKSIYFYYPYPDYKLPTSIYSDDYIPDETANFPCFRNYDNSRLKIFNEELTYKSLTEADDWKYLANSFLIEAANR